MEPKKVEACRENERAGRRGARFDHERLDVFQVSLDFVVLAQTIAGAAGRAAPALADQLSCAAFSIPLNIAEGSGEFSLGQYCPVKLR